MSPSSSRYWPGTKVPRSTGGPFDWRRTDHADMSPIITDDHGMRTPLFNQWLAAPRPARAHGNARQCIAGHRMSSHHKATRIAHWQQWVFRAVLVRRLRKEPQCKSVHRGASHRIASHRCARQSSSKQRGLSIGNSGFSGPLWPECKSGHRNESHCTASHSKPMQGNSKQRGSSTGNSGFSGPLWLTRPGFLGRFIN